MNVWRLHTAPPCVVVEYEASQYGMVWAICIDGAWFLCFFGSFICDFVGYFIVCVSIVCTNFMDCYLLIDLDYFGLYDCY